MEAAYSEDDDGSDFVSVQLHLQGPHPIPPQLQVDLSTGVCPACHHTLSSRTISGLKVAPGLCQTAK